MSHGVPIRAITIVCPVPARISLSRGGDLYWPDELGRRGWVFPVSVVDPGAPEYVETDDPLSVVSLGPIIDLLAFSPMAPRRWALRHGIATVLGAVEPPDFDPEPVPVRRDVTDWLRDNCRGLVLLARDPHDAASVLRGIEKIEAEDDRHAAELRRLLSLPSPVRSTVVVRQAAAA